MKKRNTFSLLTAYNVRVLIALTLVSGFIILVILYTFSWTLRRTAKAFVSGEAITRVGHDVKRVVISKSPRLIADYYSASNNRPFVILIHGSDPQGRRNTFCRLLASRLRTDGFSVLVLDLRGFGESDNPPLPLSQSFRFEDDVLLAVRYVLENALAKPGRFVFVGHSLGAGVVLRARRLQPKPAAVVAIGAPATQGLFEQGRENWRRLFAEERLKDMGITPDEQTLQVMGRYLVEMDPVSQLLRGALPPVLFIYGEEEGKYGDIPYIRTRLPVSQIPYGLHMVQRAPHSYKVLGGKWGLVFYNQTMLDSVASAVEGWALGWAKKTPEGARSEAP